MSDQKVHKRTARRRVIVAVCVAVSAAGLAAPAVSLAGGAPGGPAPVDPVHGCEDGYKWVCGA